MNNENLNEILDKSNSLNDLSRYFFNKVNYYCAEKSKKILEENGINWKEWLESKKRKPNICLQCGKEIVGRDRFIKKFCNSSCSASYNNIRRIKKAKIDNKTTEKMQNKVDNFCVKCGKKLINRQKKFCSLECLLDYRYDEYIKNWKNGKEQGLKGEYNVSNHIRRYLFEKNNNKCQICGWGEVNPHTGNIPLEVHHIDGNYTNNSEENLQLLCPNCHSLTETYKNSNKNGRKSRNKYK